MRLNAMNVQIEVNRLTRLPRLLLVGVLAALALALAQPVSAKAPDITSDTDVISLGTRHGPDGRPVQGYQIIHRRGAFAKPPGTPGGGGGGSTTSTCYTFLANGAKWKGDPKPYFVNPNNDEVGLSASEVTGAIAEAIGTWESEAGDLGIFGEQGDDDDFILDLSSMNERNEVAFGDYPSPGVIAVTNVWGYFSGPPSDRQLVEWDMLIDQVDFDWSAEANGVAGKMDLLNIVTHEVGHAMGLGHPSNTCTLETMYRSAGYGETIKRTLHDGDKAGIRALYPLP